MILSTVERKRFEETVKSLFQTKWLVELLELSFMVKMRDFPYSPTALFDIVFKCLSRFTIYRPNYWKHFPDGKAHIMIRKRKQ